MQRCHETVQGEAGRPWQSVAVESRCGTVVEFVGYFLDLGIAFPIREKRGLRTFLTSSPCNVVSNMVKLRAMLTVSKMPRTNTSSDDAYAHK